MLLAIIIRIEYIKKNVIVQRLLILFSLNLIAEFRVLFLKLLCGRNVSYRLFNLHSLVRIVSPIDQVLRTVHKYLLSYGIFQPRASLYGLTLNFMPQVSYFILTLVHVIQLVGISTFDAIGQEIDFSNLSTKLNLSYLGRR